MEQQRLALQDNALGLRPEKVLVLETIGSVERFVNAIRKIQGLEWLGEFELDNIPPDHGFQDEDRPDKPLKGHLYLVLSDIRALKELKSLFAHWKKNPNKPFARGLAPLKQAFKFLNTIRPWGIEDRIRETGILEDWRFRVKYVKSDVPFEAELWFRKDPERQKIASTQITNSILSMGGQIIRDAVIPEIRYHAVLGRMPRSCVQSLADNSESYRNIELLHCEDIKYARPLGQCSVFVPSDDSRDLFVNRGGDRSTQSGGFPNGEPVIALFDGMPLGGHELLHGRLVVDDPDGYESAYQAKERIHGTAMASLICHGDLSLQEPTIERPIYVRPIFQPQHDLDHIFRSETIPEDQLPVDLVHRAVRRLYESENGELPAAPTVQVINLSVGDPQQPFMQEVSSWARLLDWLSWKYQILFIVSAGNHSQEIELDLERTALGSLMFADLQSAVIKALLDDTRNRRLLAPAETLNGLTIGALHDDASIVQGTSSIAIDPFFQFGLPNVASAHGPGYRRAIKPEILLPGGKQFVTEKIGNVHSKATLQLVNSFSAPGQLVATPGNAGHLGQTRFTRGTSNATAIASRAASNVISLLDQLRKQPDVNLPAQYNVPLAKALLVHGADWSFTYSVFEKTFRGSMNRQELKGVIERFVGYGAGDVGKVMACTEQRVTAVGFGALEDGKAAEFRFPLPPSLATVTTRRRLTITLAWLSPVDSSQRRYRVAHLWFTAKNDLTPKRILADHRAVRRGTLQHEVFEGQKATVFQDGESITLTVNCRSDARSISDAIRFGLAVTLEVDQGINLPIYQEVRDRLRIRVMEQSVGVTRTPI